MFHYLLTFINVILFFILILAAPACGQNLQNGSIVEDRIVSIPYQYTYLLPSFTGNINYTFINGTSTSDSSINTLF